MDLAEFLQTVSTFSDFTQGELDTLERVLRVDHFPPQHVFFREGEKGDTLYILMEGEVQMFRRHRAGRGIDELGTLGPGDLFGLQSLVDNQSRYATCRSTTPVTVASLPRTAFTLLYNTHFALAEHFQFIVARQLVRELRRLDQGLSASIRTGDAAPLLQAARRRVTDRA